MLDLLGRNMSVKGWSQMVQYRLVLDIFLLMLVNLLCQLVLIYKEKVLIFKVMLDFNF